MNESPKTAECCPSSIKLRGSRAVRATTFEHHGKYFLFQEQESHSYDSEREPFLFPGESYGS